MKLAHILAYLAISGIALSTHAQTQPKDGGTIKIGLPAREITNGLDPHVIQGESTAWVLGQMAEGLLNFDKNMDIVPWLAQSWSMSKDRKTYTFVLHKGVKFQNSREMTAEDVKFSLERILDPKTGSRRRQNLSMIERVDVIDPYTVAIRLKAPYAPLLSTLAGVWVPIIAKEGIKPDGSISQLIGTGPFTLVKWVKNDSLSLKKFAGYWRRGEPRVDGVTFVSLPDDATRMTALRTGAVDVITSVPPQLLPSLTSNNARGFELLVRPGTIWHMAVMNTTKPPFNDVRVRQAVNLALDRKAMVQMLTFGFGKADNQTYDENSFWRLKGEVPNADLKKARALLAEAGYKQGLPIIIESKPEGRNDAQVVQSQLNAAGFQVTIKISDGVALNKRMKAYNFQLAISSSDWYVDPDFRFSRFYTKSGPAHYLAGGYDNPSVAELLAQARLESDPVKRKAIYQQAFDMIERDVPSVLLYFDPRALAWRNDVKGFNINPNGDLSYADGGLAKVWLDR